MSDSQPLNRQFFQNLQGDDFLIDLGGDSITLRLVEVDVSRISADKERPFSLRFHGPLQPILEQGMRAMSHNEVDELTLFLVPNGPDGDAMQYEAVFN